MVESKVVWYPWGRTLANLPIEFHGKEVNYKIIDDDNKILQQGIKVAKKYSNHTGIGFNMGETMKFIDKKIIMWVGDAREMINL